MEREDLSLDRFLDDHTNNVTILLTTSSDVNNSTKTELNNDANVLQDTFLVYGSSLVLVWLLFCWVRLQFPRPFTVRHWTSKNDLKTPFAANQHGFFSWMWRIQLTDDEMMDHCSLDALCLLRTLRFGLKLCLLGIFNSIWLFPLYSWAPPATDTDDVTDPIVRLTVSHLPNESPRFVGTVIAAYILFGFTMYHIWKEFQWFICTRHKYLRKAEPRNYSVYIHNIPPHLRTNAALEDLYQRCFKGNSVVEARIHLKASNLVGAVQKRKTVIWNLETALAQEELTGEPPTHAPSIMSGEMVDSIEAYTQELQELNTEITERIETLERISDARDMIVRSDRLSPRSVTRRAIFAGEEEGVGLLSSDNDALWRSRNADDRDASEHMRALIANGFRSVVTEGLDTVSNLASTAVTWVMGGEDGEPDDAGFLSFPNLAVTNAALQMVQSPTPFQMSVEHAPDPDDVFWMNVGRTHKDLMIGQLLSKAATATMCLFWTFPTSFVAALSSVEGLKDQFDFVADAIEAFPPLEAILQQVAPFALVAFNSLLPHILRALSMYEGPVSAAAVEASTFTKLAAFMIVQTFFVSALSGGLLKGIETFVNDPTLIIEFLGKTLPTQSTFFMQIAFVDMCVLVLMENLRLFPLGTALLRRCIGPRLTEKQRQTTYLGFLRPLAEPCPFRHAWHMAQIAVLYFMVILVYLPIAPLTSYVLGFCFVVLGPSYLHQFVYTYPKRPDSGGIIWLRFIKILLFCMLIAQFTIVGLLGLKRAGIATPLMAPLIVITILFNAYINQRHFHVAEYLPADQCLAADLRNEPNFDLSFLRKAYLQDEMREKVVLPEGLTPEHAAALGFDPVQSSVAEQPQNNAPFSPSNEQPARTDKQPSTTSESLREDTAVSNANLTLGRGRWSTTQEAEEEGAVTSLTVAEASLGRFADCLDANQSEVSESKST